MNAATEFDVGPLTWVKSEIDLALERAGQALQQYASGMAAGNADLTQIKFARTHLHQVQGALTIVGLDGVTHFAEALEFLLEAAEQQKIPPDDALLALVLRALEAIRHYLDDLVGGEPNLPLRLLPLYREVQTARGYSRFSATDLFFPDLSIRPPRRSVNLGAMQHDDFLKMLRQERARFQRGLLAWLRAPQDRSGVTEMLAAVKLIEATQEAPAARAFWWIATAFLSALSEGSLAPEADVKQLCARIDLQIRRLLEGSRNVAERLMRDALYFVANTDSANESVRQVKSTYRLQNAIPSTAAQVPAAQESIRRRLREIIAATEDAWNRFCAGTTQALPPFRENAGSVSAMIAQLGHADYSRLGQAIATAAQWLAEQPARHSEALAMEIATAILLAQNAQENFLHLGADFAHQVDVMVARIKGCITGNPPLPGSEVPSLDEISRQAQEKLLIGQVAREIQSNLAQIEQVLDTFFRDVERRGDLAALDMPIRQIIGALTVMRHDAAVDALRECAEEIRQFSAPDYLPQEGDFERVADRLSVLGFFIDALPHGVSDFATFARNLQSGPQVAEDVEEEGSTSVEQEVEQQKREAQALLSALREQPTDSALREELRQNLTSLQKDADLVADRELGQQAKAMLSALETGAADTPRMDDAFAGLMPQAPETPQTSAETMQLSQASTEEIDAELLSIFLEEAHEVLGTIDENLKVLQAQPHDTDALTNIRRSFHTLKGSGRMVGLRDLGEAAWSMEQVLNQWLRQGLEVDERLLGLLNQAHTVFATWVEHLEQHSCPAPDPGAMIALAGALMGGAEAPPASPAALPSAPTVAATEIAGAVEPAGSPETVEQVEFPELGGGDEFGEFAEFEELAVEPQNETARSIDQEADREAVPFAEQAVEEAPFSFEMSIGESPLTTLRDSPQVPGVAPETSEIPEVLSAEPTVTEPADEPPADETPFSFDLAVDDDSLTTALDSAQFSAVAPEAPEISASLPEEAPASAPAFEQSSDEAPFSFELAADEGSLTVSHDTAQLPPVASGTPEIPEALLAEEAPTVTPISEQIADEAPFSLELADEENPQTVPPADLPETPAVPSAEMEKAPSAQLLASVSPTLLEIFREEAQNHLLTLQREFSAIEAEMAIPTPQAMYRAAHTLAGIAGTVGLPPVNQLGLALEHALLRREHASQPGSYEALEVIRQTIAHIEQMLAAIGEMHDPQAAPHLIDALEGLYPAPVVEAAEARSPAPLETVPEIAEPVEDIPAPTAFTISAPLLKDELDEQLLPIFLEEALDLNRDITTQLRTWRGAPGSDEPPRMLARLLHTLKGSARMAGAMNLGEITHLIESRVGQLHGSGAVTPEQIDEIDNAFDSVAQIIERLESGESLDAVPVETVLPLPEPVPENTAVPSASPGTLASPPSPPPPVVPERRHEDRPHIETEGEGAAQRPMLRVRADLIDRLVNEAGELSIARARIEGEMRALKESLLDLTANVIRLRRQLRDIEIQAESQMQSRTAQADERHAGFDPLEFDRFTRFQELTRMMAESVNDVATVQQNLLKNLDDANAAIIAQARLNREVQQELMSVRMVPFGSVADRLYRIVRQTAKELGKRANLEIQGSQVEVDRSVLEKVVAPLEHMLRNSIAHGLETREVRLACGKPEIGDIALHLGQEGNEIILSFSDDGAGLDLERIRARGIENGLLAADEEVEPARLTELIFNAGFSTAKELSQVAGRGVGMDVVKTEISNLGGRIEVDSVPGKGTTFRLYIPLTLAVTKALLVRSGSRLYAIPSVMIEQVLDLKENALARIRETGAAEWMGNHYPFHFLPHLLGDTQALPEVHRQYWILLLRSGSQRIAVQVDELRGNQEIVVKNIGPQLARVIGIAGATVLGDGQVVLILNPAALASQPRTQPATAAVPTAQPTAAQDSGASGLPTVMVVDDSLTVRKITSRLLSREGYQVMLAKDGVDGLEQLQDALPDVLLVDIEMPRMDGFDFTRNVRADDRLKHIPIIMITSRTADKHRNYAFEIGVNQYLGKPYQEEELLGLVAGYIKEKAQQRLHPQPS